MVGDNVLSRSWLLSCAQKEQLEALDTAAWLTTVGVLGGLEKEAATQPMGGE